MNFQTASRIYESMRLGGSKRDALSVLDDEKSTRIFYRLLYPQNKILTKGQLTAKFADEVGVFIDVVMDVLGDKDLASTLAQESNESTSRGWTVSEAMRLAEALSLGSVKVLETAHKMDEIEARLFWNYVLANKPPITKRAFLVCVGMNRGLPESVMRRHASLKEPEELIRILYTDPGSLDSPDRWYEETGLALSPRRYDPFHPHDTVDKITEFNGSVYQRIPNKGVTRMLYVLREADGVRFVWRDRSGKVTSGGQTPDASWLPNTPMILETVTDGNNIHVYDAVFPRYHTLPLEERLAKLQDHVRDTPIIVHQPTRIDSMADLISSLNDNEAIRFPDLGPYQPLSRGGYVLMSSLSRVVLRLHSIRVGEDSMTVRLSCVDGYDDFIVVGEVDVLDPEMRYRMRETLSRMGQSPLGGWYDIDDDVIVALEVVVPSILKDPLSIPDALVSSVRDDLGISDIIQYVDFIHTS